MRSGSSTLQPRCASAMRWAAQSVLRREEVIGTLLLWSGGFWQALLEGKEEWQQYAAAALHG